MEARPFFPVASGRIFLATLHTRVIAKHKVVGMLFFLPTATHPSGLSPGHCSRTPPPTCMKGSSGSQTRWRKCSRAALGPVVSLPLPPAPPQAGPGGLEHPGDHHSPASINTSSAGSPPPLAGHPWWLRSEGALLVGSALHQPMGQEHGM